MRSGRGIVGARLAAAGWQTWITSLRSLFSTPIVAFWTSASS